jgi:hypothetical protein
MAQVLWDKFLLQMAQLNWNEGVLLNNRQTI